MTASAFSTGDTSTEILIVGGGVGACAAALAATSMGKRVVMTEATQWIGGQLTSQAVPPDEHSWIEQFGCTARYRDYRNMVRDYYRRHHPLTPSARSNRYLNPGNGFVSRLCHEPKIALAVLEAMLAPARTAGLLSIRLGRQPQSVDMDGDLVKAVTFTNLATGDTETIEASYVLDATELGDLLALGNIEYRTGFESQRETGEPHALAGDPEPDNVQALSWVFAMGFEPGSDHTIDKPSQYDYWKTFEPPTDPPWGGPLFQWGRPVLTASSFLEAEGQAHGTMRWEDRVLFADETSEPRQAWFPWRRIVYPGHYPTGTVPHEVSLVIWTQNDYMSGNIIDKPEDQVQQYLEESRQQSLSFLYWMQTEAPRPDGGLGYPGLFPAPDMVGTETGLAMAPYIRESRRIKAIFTVTENHIGATARGTSEAESFFDTVGVGLYHIDLHFSTGGNHPIHMDCLPFQIPLGALIPIRVENLLPACKNLGVTHLTNGSFRLHPVEWNIGEAAGLLASFCLNTNTRPQGVREDRRVLREFQDLCLAQGFELEWPQPVAESGWAAFDKRVLGYLPSGALPRTEWDPGSGSP